MKRAENIFALGLILAAAASADDLPPEVLLLARIRRHIGEELRRLPSVTCLETVKRELKPAKGNMRPLDTVRLEVLSNGDRELFASPGDRKFSEKPPIDYVGSGALGDGVFGLYWKNIVVSGLGSYEYKGEEVIGGRHLARWNYRLPEMWSGQTIQLPEGSGKVGLHGAFWADPGTYDVTRLELNADGFPPALPLTEAVTTIDYARINLGNDVVALLPVSGDFRMVRESGQVNHNQIAFTGCRWFGAQSVLSFDDQHPGADFGTISIDDTLRPLPAGLQITVKLRSPISGEMPVGTLIYGVVAGKEAAAIPAGSPVRGRIRRLEHYADPFQYYVVALEFTEIEVQGIRYRFYADLLNMDSLPGLEQTTLPVASKTQQIGLTSIRTSETVEIPKLPGTATFFIRAGKLDLPQGFRTTWMTRSLAP